MDTERWKAAEGRRARKMQEIEQLLSAVLGANVDLNQEAKNIIDQWEETVEMEDRPRQLRTPLQRLLREYHEIREGILDIEDEKRRSKE